MIIYNDPEQVLQLNWKDKIFLHHTGNMFGMGCYAFSRKARDKISRLKDRTDQKGYIILIPDREWLTEFGIKVEPAVNRLLQQYWPGNLSVIFRDAENRFSHLSYNNNIAIRVPSDPFLRKFLRTVGEPIISTSVNTSNEPPLMALSLIEGQRDGWFDFALLPEVINEMQIPSPSTLIDVSQEEVLFLREGSIPFKALSLSLEQPLILFVCTGNICRSPMAEYLARRLFFENRLKFRTASAGFMENKVKISTNSYKILLDKGINAAEHLSRKLTKAIIENSWLILTMEISHKERLLALDPKAEGKLYTLSEFCGQEYCQPDCNIDDPYGLDIEYYKETYGSIEKRINRLVEILRQEE